MTNSVSGVPSLQSYCEQHLLKKRPKWLFDYALSRRRTVLAIKALNQLFRTQALAKPIPNACLGLSTESTNLVYDLFHHSKSVPCIYCFSPKHIAIKWTVISSQLVKIINKFNIPCFRLEGQIANSSPLVPALLSCKGLQILDLNDDRDAVKQLILILPKMRLRSLCVDKIWSNDVKKFARAVVKTKTLQRLRISFRSLKPPASQILLSSLLGQGPHYFTALDLRQRTISEEVAQVLAQALRINTSLHTLSLYGCKLPDSTLAIIATALKDNGTLKTLNIGWNYIGPATCKALSTTLTKNSSLTTLLLCYSSVGDKNIKILAKGLEQNRSLKRLSLEGTRMGDEGFKALVDVLETNLSLNHLGLRINYITTKWITHLAEILHSKRRKIKIDLWQNKGLRHSFTKLREAASHIPFRIWFQLSFV